MKTTSEKFVAGMLDLHQHFVEISEEIIDYQELRVECENLPRDLRGILQDELELVYPIY